MNSFSTATSPCPTNDAEVLSQRAYLDRGGANEDVEKVPEVNTSVAEDVGEATPMTTDGGDPHQSGAQPGPYSGDPYSSAIR